MNGEGCENALEFGEQKFGEEECGVENDGGNKCIKEMANDRFGELPDSLLIHILSFLNVKEAAITCVLSKRWKFLWTELPNLEFKGEFQRLDLRESWEFEKVRNFVAWINRTLAIRTVNYLEKFGVSFVYHKCFSSDVDAWVQFAVKSKVKTLNLVLHCWDDFYTLPQVMYSCPSLTTLCIIGCIMDSERTIEWQSLTHLYLQEVDIDQCLLDEILSTCPVLYVIDLDRCCGFDSLEVNSRSLHNISITDSECESAPLLKISAPYLHSLHAWLLMEGRMLQLGNITSLAKAHINCHEFSAESNYMEAMSGAKELLESIQHVKELSMGFIFIKVVSMMVVNGWQLPQSRREILRVTSASEYEPSIFGIIGLLESSPNLESLSLEGYETVEQIFDLDPAAKGDLDGDLLHLKTIRVVNFADSNGEPLLTLARILLKRAPSLEEMMITIDVEDTSDFVNIAQALLSYPRSSTKAEIHLMRS